MKQNDGVPTASFYGKFVYLNRAARSVIGSGDAVRLFYSSELGVVVIAGARKTHAGNGVCSRFGYERGMVYTGREIGFIDYAGLMGHKTECDVAVMDSVRVLVVYDFSERLRFRRRAPNAVRA